MEVFETVYGKCCWPTIINGVVFAHPVSNEGLPYINQLLPIRSASIVERLMFLFGREPKLT